MSDDGYFAVIGAGPAGLAAAHELAVSQNIKPVVFEAAHECGGISKTVEVRGNRLDIGGHRFFTKSIEVLRYWLSILPIEDGVRGRNFLAGWPAILNDPLKTADPALEADVMLVRQRKSRILFEGNLLDYPLSLNANLFTTLGFKRTIGIGFSYAVTHVRPAREIRTMEDFYISRFGRALYETFFKTYTEKVWGIPCSELAAEWGAQRIKGLSVAKVLLNSIAPGKIVREISLVEAFLYPKLGPGQLWEKNASVIERNGGRINRGYNVISFIRNGSAIQSVRARNDSGREIVLPVRAVISTMPLDDLMRAIEPAVPAEVLSAAVNLPYRDFITVGILLKKLSRTGKSVAVHSAPMRDNWIYVQESGVSIGRIQFFKNWSGAMVADPNTEWLGLEYFCSRGDSLWSMTDSALVELGIAELERIGFARKEDLLDACVVRMPKAYPVYSSGYEKLSLVKKYLDGIVNLYPAGRNGLHRYNNQDHSVMSGLLAARLAASGSSDKQSLWEINVDQEYYESGRPQPAV